jgi:hypothetical protein
MPVEREGFGITVPMTWWEFDLHPATRDDSERRLLAQRVRENPSPVTTVEIPETRLAARTFGIEDVAVCRATRGPCGRS